MSFRVKAVVLEQLVNDVLDCGSSHLCEGIPTQAVGLMHGLKPDLTREGTQGRMELCTGKGTDTCPGRTKESSCCCESWASMKTLLPRSRPTDARPLGYLAQRKKGTSMAACLFFLCTGRKDTVPRFSGACDQATVQELCTSSLLGTHTVTPTTADVMVQDEQSQVQTDRKMERRSSSEVEGDQVESDRAHDEAAALAGCFGDVWRAGNAVTLCQRCRREGCFHHSAHMLRNECCHAFDGVPRTCHQAPFAAALWKADKSEGPNCPTSVRRLRAQLRLATVDSRRKLTSVLAS